MATTTERINFASIKKPFEYPDFLDIQLQSFKDFFQLETNPDNRKNEGLYKVFSENFPITDARNNFVLEFLDYYKKHINEKTYPYKDISLLLNTLQDNNIKLAVASNKFQEGVDFLLKYYFPEINFAAAVGPGGDISTKPDPKMVNKILSTVNVSPDETLYLGDSNVDMITARNAGIKPIGVSWGYRTRKELEENGAWRIIDNPMDFYDLYVK